MTVIRRTEPIPGDKNHTYRFARVGEIEFLAFPYQHYNGNLGMINAEVSDHGFLDGKPRALVLVFSAGITRSLPDGKRTPLCYQRFTDQEQAFEWAAQQILAWQPKEGANQPA
jgi:hypothetical protein